MKIIYQIGIIFSLCWVSQIVEKLLVHTDMTREEARREAVRLLEQVGSPEAGRRVRQDPHEFS